jgi:hypothetical protein
MFAWPDAPVHMCNCRVRGYDERLSRQPSSPEEFVAHAGLIAEVEAARPAMDKEYDHVSALTGGGGGGGRQQAKEGVGGRVGWGVVIAEVEATRPAIDKEYDLVSDLPVARKARFGLGV